MLDELHKAPKWRNLLKGIIDEYGQHPPLLVTGSARLDALRRSGDALTGRTYFYRLHPVDLARVSSWRGPSDLVELLRERVGQPVNYDNLSQSLGVSPPAVKSWVELLEKLYIVFLLPPYSANLSRSIRKDRRVYFTDCAAAHDDRGGARLENVVVCGLLKFVQWRKDAFGESWELYYLRDKEQREVDFVVTRSLDYYTQRLKPVRALQLVRALGLTPTRNSSRRSNVVLNFPRLVSD